MACTLQAQLSSSQEELEQISRQAHDARQALQEAQSALAASKEELASAGEAPATVLLDHAHALSGLSIGLMSSSFLSFLWI